MKQDARINTRFNELEVSANNVRFSHPEGLTVSYVDSESWQKWSTNVLNLLQTVFGPNSVHYQNFKKIHDNFSGYASDFHCADFQSALGVFKAAKEDYEGGYVFSLENAVSGEIFGDFIALAKQSLSDGHKDVAAVLACAALEDALKRFASTHGLDVEGEAMQQVVAALKSKGLVMGAQKTLLDTMPKIRDYAMHANWDKITAPDVSSIIGFVEQFLITNF
jgi:hypothetical protein